MKITIEWSEVKTSSTGKEYKKVSAKDEQGNPLEASVWSDAPFYAQIAAGATIDAEVRVSPDGKYKNIVGGKMTPRGASTAHREQMIAKAQENKAWQIYEAQDRSAWMWARNNAALIVAQHTAYKFLNENEIVSTVEELATKIYNLEPTAPFNA